MERLNVSIGGDPEFLPIFFGSGRALFVPALSIIEGNLNTKVGVDEDSRKGEIRPDYADTEKDTNLIAKLFQNFLFEYLKANGMVKKHNAKKMMDYGVAYLTGEIEVAKPLTVAGHFHIGSDNEEVQAILREEHATIGEYIDKIVKEYFDSVDDPSRLSSKFGRGSDVTRPKQYGLEYRRVMGRSWILFSVFKEIWISVMSAVGNYLYNRYQKQILNPLKPYVNDEEWERLITSIDVSELKDKLRPFTSLITYNASPNILYLPIGISDDWNQENAISLLKEFIKSPYGNGQKHFLFFGLSESRGYNIFIHNEYNLYYRNPYVFEQKEVYIGLPAALRLKKTDPQVYEQLFTKLYDIIENRKENIGLDVVVENGLATGIKEVERKIIVNITTVSLSNFEVPSLDSEEQNIKTDYNFGGLEVCAY